MKTTKQAIPLNQRPKTQAKARADLAVTAEQAQPIAGGTDVIMSAGPGAGGHVNVFNGATGTGNAPSSGGYFDNHNETVEYDEADLDELEDLLMIPTQEPNIKGGDGDYQAVVFVGGWGASLHSNHNETVVADNQKSNNQQSLIENTAGAESLTDLPLTATQAEEIKAGDGNATSPGAWPWQLSQQRQG